MPPPQFGPGAAQRPRSQLVCALAAWFALHAAPGIGQQDPEATRAELDQLTEEIERIEQRVKSDTQQETRLQRAFARTEVAIGDNVRRIRQTQERLASLNRKQQNLEDRQQALEEQLDARYAAVSRQLRKVYELGSGQDFKLLLGQRDPGSIARLLTYIDYANKAQLQVIEDFLATRQSLLDTTRQLQTSRRELAEVNESLRRQTAALREQQARRENQLQDLRRQLNRDRRNIAKLQSERQRLEQLILELEEAVTRSEVTQPEDFAASAGSLPWPVQGSLRYRFGASRHGSSLAWQGVEIEAPEGSDVRAIHAGRVVFSDWLRGQGLLLILDHGSGYMSLYGHNQSLLKDIGSFVAAGESIATVGRSGGNDRDGLYFEIRHNGNPLNPEKWCRR